MSVEENYLSEEVNFNYYCITGCYDLCNPKRMSPSSWDDSDEEEELTDTNSSFDCSDSTQTRFYGEGFGDVADRRQTLARVRRRTKDSAKSSLSEDIHRGNNLNDWDDQDTDGIIFDIEKYLKEQNIPQTYPKWSMYNESGISYNKSNKKLLKISEESVSFRNLNSKLSRIVEVDEPKSVWENSDCEISARDNCERRMSYTHLAQCKTVDENRPMSENEVRIVFSPEGGDSERMWDRIDSRMRNPEYDTYYERCEYEDNSPKHLLGGIDSPEKVQQNRSDNLVGFNFYSGKLTSKDSCENTVKIEENELFQSFREVNSAKGRNDVEDKISIDKVEDVSDCTGTTHESGTPRRQGNLTGREKDHAPSKESLELGLENLFSLTRPTFPISSVSKNHHDMITSTSYDLVPKNEYFYGKVFLPSGDRQVIFKPRTRYEDCSSNSPKSMIIFHSEEMNDLPRISPYENIDNLNSNDEASMAAPRNYPSDRGSLFGDLPKVDEPDKESVRGGKKSKSSIENNILLELDVSDKSSITEMKIFGDSLSELESSGTSKSTKNNGGSPSSIIHKSSKTGKPSTTRSYGTDDGSLSNRNHRLSLFKCGKFGSGDFGDNASNMVEHTGKCMDYPRDSGDMKLEGYGVKSEWERLIVQLDERFAIRKPIESVFRIDVEQNPKSKTLKGDDYRETFTKPVETVGRFNRRNSWIIKDKSGTWKKTKARKRKREIAFEGEANTTNIVSFQNNHNQVLKRNWLVNTSTTKRSVLKHGKRSFKTFLVVRGRRQNHKKRRYNLQDSTQQFISSTTGSFDCFRTLFKRFVNFFTVLCRKNRN